MRKKIYILILLIVIFSVLVFPKFKKEQENLNNPATFGVSFEPSYARFLGLSAQEVYRDMLTNLNIKHIRLNAYWDKIEPQPDVYNFEELNYYLDEAEKENVKVILTVGFKLPRWPECRHPDWVSIKDIEYLRERQLTMVSNVIRYYNDNPTITAFQIENEPLLPFGICPKPDGEFLKKEIQMVRGLTKKPLVLTDSGEVRLWKEPMELSDIFGTTLYRKVYDKRVGYLYYPLPPSFYSFKSELIRKYFAPNNKKTIIAELQGEVWLDKPMSQIPVDTLAKNHSLNDLKNTVAFARKTGFGEYYLWGVEWWYYMAKHGHPEYLEFTKTLF